MNTQKKIAVIGASYLQLPLVLKCKELNYYSICFAHIEGAVCADVCDQFYPISVLEKEEILKICKELQIDAVLTIASDIAVSTVNYVAEKLNLFGNPTSSSQLCTDKNKMKEALSNYHLPTAKFCQLTEAKEFHLLSSFNFPLIVKPADRSGSLGVTKVNTFEALTLAFETAMHHSLNKSVIVEEFIIGKEISVESITFEGKHFFLALTDKVTSGAPHFVELEHHQPAKLSEEDTTLIKEILSKALNALQIKNGASHSELIIDSNNNIIINEIGARMGGDFIGSHLVQLSTGYDFLKGVLDVALGEFKEIKIHTNIAFSGVLFLSSITDFEKRINPNQREIVQYEINEIKNETLTKSADRNGFYIYQADKKINFDSI